MVWIDPDNLTVKCLSFHQPRGLLIFDSQAKLFVDAGRRIRMATGRGDGPARSLSIAGPLTSEDSALLSIHRVNVPRRDSRTSLQSWARCVPRALLSKKYVSRGRLKGNSTGTSFRD